MVGDDRAGVPAPDDERRGHHGHGLDMLAEPEPAQLAGAVGRQRDRGADLAQFAGAFVDLHRETRPLQRDAQGQATDPGPGDHDATMHGGSVTRLIPEEKGLNHSGSRGPPSEYPRPE
jgi:hypothetical protein